VAAHRVLRSGGRIALDSPNRQVTQSIRWLHPEHTVEFAVDEIVELLRLAGFEDIQVRGVLHAYDAARHRYLTLGELAAMSGRAERAQGATSRPEEAFVWWAEAIRGNRRPDEEVLTRRVSELLNRFRRHRLSHGMSCDGDVEEFAHVGLVVRARPGKSGAMLFGPYLPMPAGNWTASFDLAAADTSQQPSDARLASLEVTRGESATKLAALPMFVGDLNRDRQWSRHDVSFAVDETITGVEFRVVSDGRLDFVARASIDLRPAGQVALPPLPPPTRRVKRRLSRLLQR
jgi:hypothetical protein